MELRELVMTLIVVGAIAIVGVIIFASVKNTGDNLLDPDTNHQTNETINITMQTDDAENSTLLTNKGFITGTDVVANSTNHTKILIRDTDYSITLHGASGALDATANFTMISNLGYNNTEIKASYDYASESAAQASTDNISDTVLDSFELGVIALIVLAAVVILAVLFRLGSQ